MLPLMRTVLVCLLSAALCAACQRESNVDEPESSSEQLDETTSIVVVESSEGSRALVVSDEASNDDDTKPGTASGQVEGELESDETLVGRTGDDPDEGLPPARDLSAELGAAVGIPTDCTADFERATPTTIRVDVTALVRPSGAVTQASATGTGLTLSARQCIARRAESVVLQPLDDGLSQRVSTVIEIDYVPPSSTVVGVKAGAPDPELRNVRDPLPPRPEVAPSGRPIQEPTSRPIQEPRSRSIQEPSSRKVRGPQPRPIDGWDVDESSKDWR